MIGIELMEKWTYAGVFLLSVLGNLGLPLPEEVIFITAGYLASNHVVSFPGILIFSIFSVLVANNLSFFIGRKFGCRLFKFLKRFSGISYAIRKAEEFIQEHGAKTIFFSRFLWNIRNYIPLLAGSMNMKWKRFQIFDLLATLIYIPLLVILGFFFSNVMNTLLRGLNEIKFIILITFAMFIALWLSKKIYKKIFKKRLEKMFENQMDNLNNCKIK